MSSYYYKGVSIEGVIAPCACLVSVLLVILYPSVIILFGWFSEVSAVLLIPYIILIFAVNAFAARHVYKNSKTYKD